MKAIKLPPQSEMQLQALDEMYRTTKDVRLQQRVQMILLAAEKQLVAGEIAEIVRKDEQTVRRWLKRYVAEGIEGLKDAPRPGGQMIVTDVYRTKLVATVRRRPRSLGQPYSMWSLQRLADYMAEETGLRVSDETVRRHLAAEGIVLSRPQHKVSSPDPDYAVKKRRLKQRETI
jgi:transposase